MTFPQTCDGFAIKGDPGPPGAAEYGVFTWTGDVAAPAAETEILLTQARWADQVTLGPDGRVRPLVPGRLWLITATVFFTASAATRLAARVGGTMAPQVLTTAATGLVEPVSDPERATLTWTVPGQEKALETAGEGISVFVRSPDGFVRVREVLLTVRQLGDRRMPVG